MGQSSTRLSITTSSRKLNIYPQHLQPGIAPGIFLTLKINIMHSVLITTAAKVDRLPRTQLVFYIPIESGQLVLKTIHTRKPVTKTKNWYTYDEAKKLIGRENKVWFKKKKSYAKYSSIDGVIHYLWTSIEA
jgi:hypothetical protein